MSKKRIVSIVMLAVLAAGICLAVYGAAGKSVYDNAAAMLGGDKRAAIGYIQNPSTLNELGNMSKLGADKVKKFLTDLGQDASAVSAAVDERAGYEAAAANSKDRDKFLAYAMSVDETVTADNLNEAVDIMRGQGKKRTIRIPEDSIIAYLRGCEIRKPPTEEELREMAAAKTTKPLRLERRKK